ncbi:hypothetical protein E2562_015318 [Oryza meyeriana var. granulata]|uniref:Uncharacterized protein n=1 Tax=Oryza meyeriana var. granulata TaxID=110450 RepID=A0A6G1DJQ6_9ORYZ|nr:hypothetical protein E2562_015318 [Oryza meyeriana var. granulata]
MRYQGLGRVIRAADEWAQRYGDTSRRAICTSRSRPPCASHRTTRWSTCCSSKRTRGWNRINRGPGTLSICGKKTPTALVSCSFFLLDAPLSQSIHPSTSTGGEIIEKEDTGDGLRDSYAMETHLARRRIRSSA